MNKLFDVLLNYVLSPALLIYAVILYLYFVKVAVLWSLPKGAVAYIVVSFISATFILKSCQPFLERRYYEWFCYVKDKPIEDFKMSKIAHILVKTRKGLSLLKKEIKK